MSKYWFDREQVDQTWLKSLTTWNFIIGCVFCGCLPAVFGVHIAFYSCREISGECLAFNQHTDFGIQVGRPGVKIKRADKYRLAIDHHAFGM